MCACGVCARVYMCANCRSGTAGFCRTGWEVPARLGRGFQKQISIPALAMSLFVPRTSANWGCPSHRWWAAASGPRGQPQGRMWASEEALLTPAASEPLCMALPPSLRHARGRPTFCPSVPFLPARPEAPWREEEEGTPSAQLPSPWSSQKGGARPAWPTARLTFRPSAPNSPCAEGKGGH